jgi:dienelactone hydrolase
LEILSAHARVDPDRVAAVGYCFGGATVMQLAYAGADLDGVVSFHGSLPPASDLTPGQIKPSILVAHGEADSFVPPERIAAFKAGLDAAEADWQMVVYSGAQHGFTNPGAGDYGLDALAHDPKADARSWALMQAFLNEVLAD